MLVTSQNCVSASAVTQVFIQTPQDLLFIPIWHTVRCYNTVVETPNDPVNTKLFMAAANTVERLSDRRAQYNPNSNTNNPSHEVFRPCVANEGGTVSHPAASQGVEQ